MPSSVYLSDPLQAGKYYVRKGLLNAKTQQRKNPYFVYMLLLPAIIIISLYWYFAQRVINASRDEASHTSSPYLDGDEITEMDSKTLSSDPVTRAAQEALYEEIMGRKLRAPPIENRILDRKRLIVLGNENGKINTGVWPGWAGSNPREVTLNWAAAGVIVQKYCPYSCEITHEESKISEADAVVLELVNHPKFGLDGQPVQYPAKNRPNPRYEQSNNNAIYSSQLPLLGTFYYEPTALYPGYTLVNPDIAARFDFTMTSSQSSTLPVTLICPWGRNVEDYLNVIPPKTPGRLLAYFSEHGAANVFTPFLDELFTAAGENIHAYIHRRNRPLPPEAGGDPYQLSNRINFVSTYKFVFITEGVEEKDFIIPEWSQAFLAGTVPIYLGSPNILDYTPGPRSFINARDFKTGTDLWNYIKSFDTTGTEGPSSADDSYAGFFAWKTGAKIAHEEDEAGRRYAVGTRQGLVSRWERSHATIISDNQKYTRPPPGNAPASEIEGTMAESLSTEFKETAKWGWRLFRERLDNCVHYAECRLCQYVHEQT